MLYGMQKIAGKWYYFDFNTGARTSNQVNYNGHWYLFSKKDGHRLIGFQKIPELNKTVYCSPKTGQMLYGLQKISGKWYMFEKEFGCKNHLPESWDVHPLKAQRRSLLIQGQED